MSAPLILAVPSKGRLQQNAEAFFARSGLELVKPRGARDYRGAIAGFPGVEIAYLSAAEITAQLGQGALHLVHYTNGRKILHPIEIEIALRRGRLVMFQACCFGFQISRGSVSDELDYHYLVDGRRGVFHACGNIFAGVVQAARRVGAFAIFVQRCGGRGHCRVRVGLDARGDDRAIRRGAAMGASAGVDADRVGRLVRAALPPRRATVAGVECLRPPDAGTSPQFRFHPES
jgi:hypothetical protein